MLLASVIICSHNPRPDYLRRSLAGLQAQSLPFSQWELLLVDNASRELLSGNWDMSWHPNSRHIRENELGLTPARLRGILEARGEVLIFVDDDNVLAPDYVKRSLSIASSHPQLGVFGAGTLEPEFEIEPPAEVLPLTSMLALRTVSRAAWTSNWHDTSLIPWGAGLCVRSKVALRYLELVKQLRTIGMLDRRGQQLFCGGDDLFSWIAAGQDLGFGLFPELQITHLINGERLNRAYFIRLIHDHSFSHGVLRYLLFGETPKRRTLGSTLGTWLNGLRRGSFSMQCKFNELAGADGAARLIKERQLSPLKEKFFPNLESSLDSSNEWKETHANHSHGD